MKRMLLAVVAAAALAACSSTPESESGAAVEDRTPGAGSGAGGGTSTQPISTTTIPGDPLKDPASPLAKRSVFFEFDRDDIKAEYRPMLEAHARYLAQNAGKRVLVQGNADDRGSREYNIGLGQRRADAVKRTLVLMGAREAQVESVSLGEEKPRCTEQTEECWAQNRRADILHAGEF
jgi:peptidoglycan-associated lipoprotein